MISAFFLVSNETTTRVSTSMTSSKPSTTTIPTYHGRRFRSNTVCQGLFFRIEKDYSNYVLSINNNNTGIILPSFQSSQFTIIFWFYLENSTNASLISLRKINDEKVFEIVVRQNR